MLSSRILFPFFVAGICASGQFAVDSGAIVDRFIDIGDKL